MLERAKIIFDIESRAIADLKSRLNDSFLQAVDIIYACKGKVIVTGIGKSGIISQKIASTLACTGTPAFFLHPAEGMHGDIGMISKGDVVIALSNSGETDELITILPIIKRYALPLIVMSSKTDSVLSKNSDVFLDTGVKEEACSLGLVPTASTAAMMAMGDALAISVLDKKGFSEEDFAALHPGGALGKKLLLRVDELMHEGDAVPLVCLQDDMKKVLLEMTSKRLGVTGVCDHNMRLAGVVTDGDLRRGLERHRNLLEMKAEDVMTTSPKTITVGAMAAQALQQMEEYEITSLFVVSDEESPVIKGIIHLHDILKAGVA